jgi:microcystin-dependent protein
MEYFIMRNIFDNNLLANYATTGDISLENWGLEVSVTANENTIITLPYTTSTTPVGEFEAQTEGRVLIRKKDSSANTVTIEPFAGCVFNGILGNIVLKSQNDYITFSNNNGNVINIHDTNLPNLIKIDNVDLKTYIDASVAGLLDYRGVYDASSNQYPTTGGSGTGGAVLKSDTWIVSVAGSLNSQPVKVGDMIIAKVNSPAQTPANWNVLAVSVYNNSISNALLALMDAFTVKMNNTNAPANPQDVPINTAYNQSFETNTTNIKMDGAVSVGSSNNIARADHVHPSDTTKQNIISGATADNIVSVNNTGQVLDSGKAFSTDTSLTANSNNKIPTEQVVKYNVDYLNNRINNLPIGAGIGSAYYFTNDTDNSYLTLSATPKNGTQAQLQTTVNNNTSLLGSFVTATALNRTIINAGIWEFNLWALSDSTQATTNVYAEVYKLSSTNVETLLFTLNNSNNIGSTTVIQYSISGTQTSYAVLSTDKLLIKLYAKTTRTQNTIVTVYYNSAQYYSHAHTPLITYHNNLAGIQGGNGNDQNYHLTQTQYNNVINQSSPTQTGYLSNTDFTTFNNKQNALTNPVTSSSATPTANQLSVFNASGTQVTPTTTLPTSAVPAFTGDVTNAEGSLALTIGNNVVTNSKLANSSITIANNNTSLGGNVTQDQITGLSTTGLVKRTSANTLGIANVNDLPFTYNNTYYVSPNGSDTNDGKTPSTPVLTLGRAVTLAGNVGIQIVVYPGTYTENTIITAQNISIVAPNGEQSGIVNFTGTITANNPASSIRVIGLNINTFIHAGAGNAYLYNSSTTSLSKTGSGYLQVSSSDSQGSTFAGTVSITGSGSVLFNERSTIGSVTINNALAQVTFANNTNSLPINILAGLMGINDTPVYTLSRVTSAVTIASGAFCYISKSTMILPTASIGNATISIATPAVITIANHNLSNGQKIYFTTTGALPTGITATTTYWVTIINTSTFNISTTYANYITNIFVATSGTQSGTHVVSLTVDNLAKITANTGSFYSLDNVLFDKTNSTLLGTVLTRTGYSDSIELTTALPIASGGTGVKNVNDLTAILNNFVGDSGSGGTKGLVPAPASGDGVANKYLDAKGGWSTPTGGGSSVVSQYLYVKPAVGVNTWDANRRMQFSQILNFLGSNITLSSTGILRLVSAGTYELTAVWQGTAGGGGGTIRWYNETSGAFVGQESAICPPDSGNTYTPNSVLYHTITITSPTNFSIRETGNGNMQPMAVNSYVIARQLNIPTPTTANDVPTGTIIQNISPNIGGYLLCNGNSYNRSEYSALFNLLNTEKGICTISINTPAVITLTNHGLTTGQKIYFTTTGALPTGLSANTTYWINVTGANTFNLATSYANLITSTYIATSGTQSGTHTMFLTIGNVSSATTFNVPDYQGKVLANASTSHGIGKFTGAETHTLTINQMPSHNHYVQGYVFNDYDANDVFSNRQGLDTGANQYNTNNVGGGQPHNNMQPTEFVYFHIKF